MGAETKDYDAENDGRYYNIHRSDQSSTQMQQGMCIPRIMSRGKRNGVPFIIIKLGKCYEVDLVEGVLLERLKHGFLVLFYSIAAHPRPRWT